MKPPGINEELGTVAALPQLHPLDEFYAHAGMVLPAIKLIPGSKVPQPQKQLLVHEGDMTPTLEAYFKSEIHLQVLQREVRGEVYYRQVVLRTESNLPVEFGAIKIMLGLFPAQARREILEERHPLGSILARHKISHLSRPKAYLELHSDNYINRALELSSEHILYGRRNTLTTPGLHPLAEIVEILPPISNS